MLLHPSLRHLLRGFRLIEKANSSTGEPFVLHNMESGADTNVRVALVTAAVVESPPGIRKG